MEDRDKIALENFREYLRIPSVQPNVDYGECVKFLNKIAKDIDLQLQEINVKPNKPVIIITWTGKDPTLPTLLLNSHMDVVPVSEEHWNYKPFGAEIDNGNIYARGTQDMKSNGIQYLEAIRRLKAKGVVCLRTVHVCFVPDEEIGGLDGMMAFIKTKEFKKLNVAVSLDEGGTNAADTMNIFYTERTVYQLNIHCKGQTKNTSLSENTAGEKIAFILSKFYDYRNSQKKLLENSDIKLGNVTSVNCTMINGNCQNEGAPCEMTVTFDCRLSDTQDVKEFDEMIQQWCKEAGPNCNIEYIQTAPQVPKTKLDASNIFWGAFKEGMKEMGLAYEVGVCIATTDSRYLRKAGVQAFGFSPNTYTPDLIHNHNEFLGVDTFLKGIDIYCVLITKIANVEKPKDCICYAKRQKAMKSGK